jgi:hypothetical protein
MSKFLKIAIAAMIAVSMWACVDNTNSNKPANANANVSNSNANATASKAAPALDTIMAQEKAANEAYTKGDGRFFQGLLSDKFMSNDMGKPSTKADAVKMISDVKCDVKSMNLSEGKLSKIDDDNYAVVYKSEADGTCKDESGKDVKIPTPMRAATVWTRGSGDKWQPIWHGDTAIVDPKNPPKMNPPSSAPPAKDEKSTANSNTNSNSNSNSSATTAADPNVYAIAAAEKAGWEAWKARDADKLGTGLASNASFVDLSGTYLGTKADILSNWTGTKCDIKSTNISDVHGETISPTFGFIMFKGTADGECDCMKLKPVWGTTFAVKEGDTWKLVFGFESPA